MDGDNQLHPEEHESQTPVPTLCTPGILLDGNRSGKTNMCMLTLKANTELGRPSQSMASRAFLCSCPWLLMGETRGGCVHVQCRIISFGKKSTGVMSGSPAAEARVLESNKPWGTTEAQHDVISCVSTLSNTPVRTVPSRVHHFASFLETSVDPLRVTPYAPPKPLWLEHGAVQYQRGRLCQRSRAELDLNGSG